MLKDMNKQTLLLTCAGIAVMSLIASNIITNKQFDVPLIGWAITCGSICVPLSYVVDDILAEVFGFKTARRVIYLGFAMNAVAVLYFQFARSMNGKETGKNKTAVERGMGCTWRTTRASCVADIIGSLANAKIMDMLHAKHGECGLFARCIASTVVGEFLDMAIFAVIAFAGVLPVEVIGQMIVTNTCAKIAVEALLYPVVTKNVIGWAKRLPDA